MAASQKDRVKASKIRGKRNPSASERVWLAAYDARKAKPKTAQVPATATRAVPSSASGNRTVRDATAALARELGAPILAVDGLKTHAQYVHETKRLDDAIAPDAFTFKPVVLEGGATAPAAPGMPAPPVAGTPLVDGPSPSEVAAASAAMDAEAAKEAASKARAKVQFRMMVLGLCMVGVRSGNELLADRADVPDMMRAALADPSEGLKFVGDACDAISDKYGFKSIPLADEAVVGGACVASALAWVAVQKKRKQKPSVNVATSPTTNAETSPHAQGVDVAAHPSPRPANVPASVFTGDEA